MKGAALDFSLRGSDGFELAVSERFEAQALGVLGPSGAGKTTLLRVMAGLERPADGRIELSGQVLSDAAKRIWTAPERRGIGVAFQEPRLFPHLSVAGNLEFALGLQGDSGAARTRMNRAVDALELGALLKRPAPRISGGQARRVAIARALVAARDALFLDEPMAGLDFDLRRGATQLFREYSEGLLVYVTHQSTELHGLVDAALVLEKGSVRAAGPYPELLQDADALDAVSRLGFENVFEVEVIAADRDRDVTTARLGAHTLSLPYAELVPGELAQAAIRPSDVLLSDRAPQGLSARNALPGRVVAVNRLRAHRSVAVDVGCVLRAELTEAGLNELGLAEGSEVWAVLKTFSLRWL